MPFEQEIPERTRSFVCEHLDEISFLWPQLINMSRCAKFTLVDFRRMEQRMLARREALAVYESAAVQLAYPYLESKDAGELFAGAWVVTTLGGPEGAPAVAARFAVGAPGERCTLARALALFAPDDFLGVWIQKGAALNAAGYEFASAAAFRRPDVFSKVFPVWALRDADPGKRLAAWKSLRRAPQHSSPEQTLAGALDDNPAVRSVALETAAWAGQRWVLDHCRRATANPTAEHWAEFGLLGVLAEEADVPIVLKLAGDAALGPVRFCLLGSLAMGAGVPCLLQAMRHGAPLEAASAGAAFTRITGQVLRAVGKVALPPADGSVPDEFEKEFLEEADLPDPEEACAYWHANESKYQPGLRYSQGLPLPNAPPFADDLDMASIYEASMRAAFLRTPGAKLIDLERFPLRL